jgi:tRNA-dihydrouridine synthase B
MSTGFTIGTVPIQPATVLAPMEGITDRPFRRLIRTLGGCGLTVTEFISSDQINKRSRRAWKMAEFDPDEHPVSIQIYGRDPQKLADAALICQDLGADFVDLNLGCPSKRVTGGLSGCALMKEPPLAQAIFDAVYAAIEIPMTVKMRLGWDDDILTAPLVVRMAEDSGAQMVTVHGRTRMQMYRGSANWHAIREVCDSVTIPVLVNGDILTVEDAVEALSISGANGVMVGRGALRDPWILRRIGDHFSGKTPYEPTLAERQAHLLAYFDLIVADTHSERGATGRMKKVTGYFTRGLPYGSELRQSVYHSHEVAPIRAAVGAWFKRLEEEEIRDGFGRIHDDQNGQYIAGDSRSLVRRNAE